MEHTGLASFSIRLLRTTAVRIPVVHEEGMMPGHWLGLVLSVSVSALILMVGSQERHPALKTLFH